MSAHTKLPIYKVTYDLLQVVTEITRNMPKDYKHSLGSKIREECVALVTYIYRANSSKNKYEHIETMLERLSVATLMLRLAKDLRLISLKQFARTVELTDQIGRQAGGWMKASRNTLVG